MFVWHTDFTLAEGLLLGAIVSSTDAAAVFSILREKPIVKTGLRPTLEFESGSNDPMAYVLVVVMLDYIVNKNSGYFDMFSSLISQMAVGAFAGFGFGFAGKLIINRIKLAFEGLYPILLLSLVYITYYSTDMVNGNGFLAVYICGVYLGNKQLLHKRTILKMFDATAWLMQIVLFLTLGLLVYPSHIIPFIGVGLLISVFLIIVARPIAVFISLLPFNFPQGKIIYFLGWLAWSCAYCVCNISVIGRNRQGRNDIQCGIFYFYYISINTRHYFAFLCPMVKSCRTQNHAAANNYRQNTDENDKSALEEIIIPKDGEIVGARVIDLQLPATSIIAMIRRDRFVTPKGSTVLEACDSLMVLLEDRKDLPCVYKSLKLSYSKTEKSQANTLLQKRVMQLRSLFRKKD